MAHVILGLLLIAPQSLYGLVKAFETGVSLFYSASSGSIKRALDGLLAQGLIEAASIEPGARGKKVYRVTDAGRAEFGSWMTGDPTGSDLEAAALPRLFFLGLLEPADRAPVLRRITARIESDLDGLVALSRRLDSVDVPDEHRDVATHQFATLDYGIASHRFALAWFRDHLAREDQRERR
ncbi:PadR family transcriptional regulator [Pseudonocardia humida]|uniref:PadR family transcriptional regulator n=1 Tax=Pseudonocardia humida TaxID=2800819 RepID=A0ABT0ZV92_9PSEU|nr:PadR family transcriptional regulator [Pseudonocardia humida]MCO1654590.1 PadR family transcriptional regulator [Pseudonocardia humida]